MTIYLVMGVDWCGDRYTLGAYSTIEKANKRMDDVAKAYKENGENFEKVVCENGETYYSVLNDEYEMLYVETYELDSDDRTIF